MSYYNQFTFIRRHWQGSDTNKADHLNEIIMLQMHFWNMRYHRTKPQNVFLSHHYIFSPIDWNQTNLAKTEKYEE